MKIRDVIVEADPKELGPMNPKMKDVLGKVHAGDVKQARADAAAKAKADAEKATQNKAEQEKIIAFAKKHDYDLEPQDIGYFKKGVEDGKRGSVDRGAGEAYGPHFGAYYRGTQIGYKMKEQGESVGEASRPTKMRFPGERFSKELNTQDFDLSSMFDHRSIDQLYKSLSNANSAIQKVTLKIEKLQDAGKKPVKTQQALDVLIRKRDYISDLIDQKEMQGEGLGEGGFFDPDQPNPGDMVKHRNGAVGKVKKIGTQGDETHVYFRDQNGEMNYGQWKKHVFPVKDTAKKTESLDKDGYHKSVENGKFMKSKYGRGDYKNAMFLHDLDQTVEPMLVTFARQEDAEKAVKQYGGTIIKSGMGTFRIVKDSEGLGEASAGATVSSNFANVEAPHLSPGDARGKTSYLGKPGSHGGDKAPPQKKVKQPKKKDGTAVNALDMGTSLFGKGAVKR